MAPAWLVMNGRFRLQQATGVQVYAAELARCLGHPQEVRPSHSLPGPVGHLWEQGLLPLGRKGRLLFSPANTGPLSVTRQVVTMHDAATLDHPQWFAPSFARWYAWLLPRLARRVAHIITVSRFSQERLACGLGISRDKISVIHPGVGHEFTPAPMEDVASMRQILGLQRPYLLCVGSLDPRKNIEGVRRVWERAHRAFPDHELVVAGGGSAIFRAGQGAQGVAPTRFTGYVERRWLPALYSGAELFVYLAHYEGFGLPPLEAMACGCPVLCSSTTAVGEGAGPGAWTVDPDAEQLAADMVTDLLGQDGVRRELAERGRRHAASFTWEACAQGTMAVLNEVEARTR
jgi:glycosyltransferase involved in cell wall biosynthesis